MGSFGCQCRPASGPEIVDVGGLNGSKPAQNPFEVVGGFAPHRFKWVLDRFRAVYATKIDDFRSRSRPALTTKQSHFQPDLLLGT